MLLITKQLHGGNNGFAWCTPGLALARGVQLLPVSVLPAPPAEHRGEGRAAATLASLLASPPGGGHSPYTTGLGAYLTVHCRKGG